MKNMKTPPKATPRKHWYTFGVEQNEDCGEEQYYDEDEEQYYDEDEEKHRYD